MPPTGFGLNVNPVVMYGVNTLQRPELIPADANRLHPLTVHRGRTVRSPGNLPRTGLSGGTIRDDHGPNGNTESTDLVQPPSLSR